VDEEHKALICAVACDRPARPQPTQLAAAKHGSGAPSQQAAPPGTATHSQQTTLMIDASP
jgi:hypothetical protein